MNIKSNKSIVIVVILLIILVFISLILLADAPKDTDWNYSKVVLDNNDQYLRVYLDRREQWHLAHQGAVAEKLKIAILTFEDKHFYHHPGINPVSIMRAFISNLKAGKVVSGGSTITMQLARLHLKGKRTFLNKFKEALVSLKLELFHTKDEILLSYLNNAPYGSNIVGIKSAAYKYFGKELQELTWAEAALFAVLPNNPGYLFPGSNSKQLKIKRDSLLRKLMKEGFLTKSQYQNSLREEIPKSQFSFPFIAPHLSDRLQDNSSNVFHTTIYKDLQIKLENIAKSKGNYLKGIGIKNLAILVSNTKTHEVKAYIGSQNYFSQSTNGFNDGVMALRSSGSILKPFIYAYALDKGIVTPNSLLEDVNKNYGILLPKNYDKKYRGIVTLSEALQKSLNIPAYEITQKLGLYDAISVLKSVGMNSLTREASSYGLSICVGGAETNLWQLSQMYQSLASKGQYNSLKVLKNQAIETKKSILSPAASYQILDILRGVKHPNHYQGVFNDLAWKTGTSNGFRDAWAVGLDEDWTIAVWAGNFTGEGNHHLSGRIIAGDILFRVRSALSPAHSEFFAKPWSDFKQVAVCALSGYSPTDSCKDTLWIDVPKNSILLEKCPYHHQIIVNETETMQVCSECWQGIEHKSISVLDYPPSVDYHLKLNGIEVATIPPHNPDCSLLHTQSKLIIKYPINNSTIYLPIDINGQVNSFQAKAVSDDKTIYWFLNDEYLGMTEDIHQMDIITNPGRKELNLINSEGISKEVIFQIKSKED